MRIRNQPLTGRHSLVFDADTGAGGTDLAGLTLEFGVGAFADSTFACPATVA